MTLKDISDKYMIPLTKLEEYESFGIIQKENMNDQDSTIRRLREILTLEKAGFKLGEIGEYQMFNEKKLYEQQVIMLAEHRKKLLDQIHEYQKSLDDLDYLITEIKENRR